MATSWIECWHKYDLKSTNVLRLSTDGATWVDLTLTADAVFTDALAEWETLANADATLTASAQTYTFSFDEDAGTVTLACDANFYAEAKYDELTLMGMPSSFGPTLSQTSTGTVYAFLALEGRIDFDMPEALEQTTLREWRHGRKDAVVTSYARKVRARFWLNTSDWATYAAGGPLLNGKTRIHCTTETTAFALGNIDGVLDVHPYKIEAGETLGDSDEAITRLTILCTEAE